MKCFKKVAALLFCVALALSVMSVAAFADDDYAELFTGATGVASKYNADFQVKLSRTPYTNEDNDRDIDKGINNGIISRDQDTAHAVEIDANQDVTFDITLFYTKTGDGAYTVDISAFSFVFDSTDNKGAVIADNGAVVITSATATATQPMVISGSGTTKTYTYSPIANSSNDIELPDSNGRVIGRITVSFDSAQKNENIYPIIKNLELTMRNDDETVQVPIAYSTNDSTGFNSAPSANNGGSSVTGNTNVNNNPGTNENPYQGCVIVATEPVIVNPVYQVTLYTFDATTTGNYANSGIIRKNATPTTLYYDFTNGSFYTGNDATLKSAYTTTVSSTAYDTILTNAAKDGYTLQGWMVTDVSGALSSTTWAAYNNTGLTNPWDKEGSYPATTQADKTLRSEKTWATDDWSKSNTRVDGEVNGSNHADVNFIPVKTDSGVTGCTKFPDHQVGNITLTAVYTRDVYTATFYSGDDNATFTFSALANINETEANVDQDSNHSNQYKYTKYYTVEDLYTAGTGSNTGTVADYLELTHDSKLDQISETNLSTVILTSQGLSRTAYKFMGWKVTDTTTEAPWAKDDVNPVDGTTDILTVATAKHYSDVTFEALWEEDIYFAKIDYQYAGNNNALILVGVPSGANGATGANFNANYTYTFTKPEGETPVDKTNNMFIVPQYLDEYGKGTKNATDTACSQRQAYVNAAHAITNNPTTGTIYGKDMISDFVANDIYAKFGSSNNYVLFAYIAPNAAADVTDVKIVESTSSSNTMLNYDGNVDNSTSGVTVGDIGNVDVLLTDRTVTSVFQITDGASDNNGQYGVRARLQADVTTDTDSGDKVNDVDRFTGFGSIKDLKTIYGKVGYTES